MNAIVPVALLILGWMANKQQQQPSPPPAAGGKRAAPPKNPPRQSMATVPVVDLSQQSAQAAVDAVVHHAIHHDAAAASPPPHDAGTPRDAGVMDAAAAMPSRPKPPPAVEVTDANAPHVVAAMALGEYIKRTHQLGSKKKPDDMVKKMQTAMGDIKADGIVGPMTRARALNLGVTLPKK